MYIYVRVCVSVRGEQKIVALPARRVDCNTYNVCQMRHTRAHSNNNTTAALTTAGSASGRKVAAIEWFIFDRF